jgi:dTDP-4-amino-4,6-dideoxygalactose transaminase
MFATVAMLGLAELPNRLNHRRRIAEVYVAELGDLIPVRAREHLPVVRMPAVVDDAPRIRADMRRRGIDLGDPWFSAPVHPEGSRSTYRPGTATRAEALTSSILNLPLHALTSEDDARLIARELARLA